MQEFTKITKSIFSCLVTDLCSSFKQRVPIIYHTHTHARTHAPMHPRTHAHTHTHTLLTQYFKPFASICSYIESTSQFTLVQQ